MYSTYVVHMYELRKQTTKLTDREVRPESAQERGQTAATKRWSGPVKREEVLSGNLIDTIPTFREQIRNTVQCDALWALRGCNRI
jgi:hypothetical protein